MKFYCYLLLFILASVSLNLQAQNTPIERSSTIESKTTGRYYVHRVKFGETAYSICRAYGISTDELKRANPFLEQSALRADHVLHIPLTPANGAEYFHIHTVQEKETLFGIAKRYSITPEQLVSLNPQTEHALIIGTQLYIPVNKQNVEASATPSPTDTSKKILSHTVRKKETLFAISNMYEVSIEDIQKYNPQIIDKKNQTKIQVGQVLSIPIFLSGVKHEKQAPPQQIQDLCDTLHPKKSLNVALLLPFNANQQKNSEDLHRAFRFAEMYEGALIALEKLRKQGLSVNLSVVDTKNVSPEALIRHAGVERADLIIGPVYQTEFLQVAKFAQSRGKTIVSPLMPIDSSLKTHSKVFQIPIGFEKQQEVILNHKQMDITKCNIVVLQKRNNDKNAEHLDPYIQKHLSNIETIFYRNTASLPDTFTIESFRNTAVEQSYLNKEHTASVKKISYATGLQPRDNFDMFFRVLHPQRENRIIISAQDEPFVSDILANLKAFADIYKCRITVYGNTSWQKFSNLELNLFYDLKLHLATPYFTNYKSDTIKDFVRAYRKQYKTEPSQFAFQGHDIMLYFASALFRYGDSFPNCFSQHSVPLLQSNYSFAPSSNGGAFENQGVFLLRYTPWMDILEYK
ncbi:MAG: PBP1 and LysM peptidoglycan-binding domain-containing protein [Bacteroidales bacterium]